MVLSVLVDSCSRVLECCVNFRRIGRECPRSQDERDNKDGAITVTKKDLISSVSAADRVLLFILFHNIVTISVPSVKVKTIRSSLYTVT